MYAFWPCLGVRRNEQRLGQVPAMRILYIVPYTPNLIRVRPYQIIRHLARRGHGVTLATLWTTPEEREEVEQLAALGLQVVSRQLSPAQSFWNCIGALPTSAPLQASFCWQPALTQAISAELTRLDATGEMAFDAVHVEHLRGARYGLWLKSRWATSRLNNRIPIVWDSVDCISYLFAQAAGKSRSLKGRLMSKLELGRTRSYEGWLQTRFDQVIVTSPVDKVALEALATPERGIGGKDAKTALQDKPDGTKHRIEVLPNGVDLDYFAPSTDAKEPATLVFSGKMSYHANESAVMHLVDDIMPLIWAVRPEVRLVIVGKDPTVHVRQLAAHHAPRVEVTGFVPDIRPYLRRATIAVCPTVYGAGIQNKILEAMACGTPVVASRHAIFALEARSGTHLLAADDANAFAQEVLALLADPVRLSQIALAGRSYVEQHHSWNAVARQLEAIYRNVLPVLDPLGAPTPRAGNPNTHEMITRFRSYQGTTQ